MEGLRTELELEEGEWTIDRKDRTGRVDRKDT